MKKTLLLLAFLGLSLGAFAQTKATQRIALVNLQRGNVVESSRAGQIGLTDGDGNQRYAQYTEVDLVPIGYTPPATGNTQNFSEFVTTTNGDIYYIDWQGRSVKLFSAAAAGDYDWLEISNNQIPNSIRDSIYTDNYASVNVRYVWPSAQFLAGDSTTVGNIVVLGNRESRMGFYRLTGPAWSSIGQEGGSLTARLGTGTSTFIVQSAGGTSSSQPSGPYRNILVVGTDSTIQMHDYPRTRNDTNAIVNFLYTDAIGVLRSSPVSELPGGSGITNNIGTIPAQIQTVFNTYGFAPVYSNSSGTFVAASTTNATTLHQFYITGITGSNVSIKGSGEAIITSTFAYTQGTMYYVTDTGTLATTADAEFDSPCVYIIKSLGSNQWIVNLSSPNHFAN